MSFTDRLVRLLTAGVEVEYECTDCESTFEGSTPECPSCGSEDVNELAGV